MTVPVPFPESPTVKTGALCTGLKIAVTFSLALSVTTQVGPLPQLPPVQPANDELAAAVAVRVTRVLGSKLALQVCPQLMPEGLLVTPPLPVPPRATVRTGEVLKLAMTEMFCIKVTLHTPVPLQAPDQPAKKEFAVGDAVSATWLPLEKVAVQAWPQSMPAGLLLTVPAPAPAALTLSWTEPVGKLELLPPPPQPQRTSSIELKQQTTAATLGLGIELPPLCPLGALRWC